MHHSFKTSLALLSITTLLAAGCQPSGSGDTESVAAESSSAVSPSAETEKPAAESHSHDHESGDNHDHGDSHDEDAQKIYDGYFEDSQVEDRLLSDWSGDWQSVYPLLQSGEFDEVFADKALHSDDMTAEEYKAYYTEGYQTDVERVVIEGNSVTFYKDGEALAGHYTYDCYEILAYEAGNRGVRFIFELAGEAAGLPQFIQFSDHSISPTDASHYHLYWGDDREALLEEVVNWPTYYPSGMNGHNIAHEMMAH
jgi:zinc transport system substrate-binding protein